MWQWRYLVCAGVCAGCDRPWLNLLLVFVPLAIAGHIVGWSTGVRFAFALLGIAPFAERLGFVTEELAKHTNETRECRAAPAELMVPSGGVLVVCSRCV